MVTRSARTNEDAFVTSTEGPTVKSAGSAQSTHSVDEVMKRHREEMGRSSTANISVKEAFRTRGDEAKKVIVSELRQMIDKRVWAYLNADMTMDVPVHMRLDRTITYHHQHRSKVR